MIGPFEQLPNILFLLEKATFTYSESALFPKLVNTNKEFDFDFHFFLSEDILDMSI